MFYPPQYVAEQFQQEEQQRKELEFLYKQQLLHHQSLLSTPPPSPMSATLGLPNRSCVSCKKRKVKCDRKTPSCTACQKSKHRCHYTSYSPPVLTEGLQQHDEDEGIKAIKRKLEELDNITKQRWEQFQRMMNVVNNKNEIVNQSGYYDDDVVYNLNLNNPVVPVSTGTTQFTLPQQQGSPQQLQIPVQQPYILNTPQQYQPPSSAETSPYIQTQNLTIPPGNYSPYMTGTIVLNYNLNAMRAFLGRPIAQILQSMTGGQGPNVPSTGFTSVVQLQDWLREKFMSQDWSEEMDSFDPDERFEIRPIYEEVNNQLLVRQKFEVILQRAEYASSPSSVHGGDFQPYDFDDKHNMEMENLTTYSETGSNRSSVIDFDPTDAFLNKIYAFVRRFIRNLPWLRENVTANWRDRSSIDTLNDGVFSDVIVEVRKISPSYTPYQDLKLIPNNNSQEEFIKGRLFF